MTQYEQSVVALNRMMAEWNRKEAADDFYEQWARDWHAAEAVRFDGLADAIEQAHA